MKMRWAGHVARTGKCRGAYRNLVDKPEGNRLLTRARHTWEDNFKMDGDVEWIVLTQDMEN